MAAEILLDIRNLRTHFQVRGHTAKAVDDVSLSIPAGQTLGLVGESGCGKSVTAHSIIRLIPEPPGKIVGGQVLFEGQDLLALSEARMRRIRGKRISMIFQEPMTSLNPT
jgi:ABC-type dipeptide/oligopeptide/nickel transport system ATPase component